MIGFLWFVDMEDLENLAKAQDAIEANDLKQWDINFWGERLRELKYDINEVHLSLSPSLSLYVPTHTHTHTHTHMHIHILILWITYVCYEI